MAATAQLNVPLVDLAWQHTEVAAEVAAGFGRVCARTAFILGDEVARFECEYAKFAGVKHAIGVANGTDAIELALRAVRIGPGDEVLLPANTFIATALAVMRVGATPVLTDCDEHHLLDLDDCARKRSARTRAILPVHLFGQLAPLDRVSAFAREHGLVIIEDAAQSHGATQVGVSTGIVGQAAATSFYPGKNLGAYGDGGAVLTNDDEVAQQVRALRNYGSERKYHHPILGMNSRLDTLQAVVLSAKLAHLAKWNEMRRAAAARYHAVLEAIPAVELPTAARGNQHVWHLYAVQVAQRDAVLARLNVAGIGAGVHYPVPIHLQGAFAHLGLGRGSFPVAEAAADRMISLPIYPGITAEQQNYVAATLARALGERA